MSGKSRMKKPRRLTIGIYLDDEVADRAELAEQAYEKVRVELERTRPRRIAEYAAAGMEPGEALSTVQDEDRGHLNALEKDAALALQDLDEATTWFVFEAIGHRRLTALIRLHPATDEQRADGEKRGQEVTWNEDTFLAALVEDSCVAPAGFDWEGVFGVDGADEGDLPAKSAWSHADVQALTATAMAANQSLRTADRERRPSLTALTGA